MHSLRSQGNSFCANDLHYCIILQSLLDRLLSICGTPFRSARRPTPIPLPLHVVGLLTLRAGRRVAAGSHPHTLPTIVLVRSFHPPTSPPECRWRHGCDADTCCRGDACCKADTCREADAIGDADSDADAECVAKAAATLLMETICVYHIYIVTSEFQFSATYPHCCIRKGKECC